MKYMKLFEGTIDNDGGFFAPSISSEPPPPILKHTEKLTNQICRNLSPLDRLRHRNMISHTILNYFKKHDLG